MTATQHIPMYHDPNRQYPCGRWFVRIADVPPDLPLEIAADWLDDHDRSEMAKLVRVRLEKGDDWWLRFQIDQFVRHVNNVIQRHYHERFPNLTPPTIVTDYMSDKWCRLLVTENGRSRSVYGFVALVDNTTRTMGHVTAGDIHKSESYKRPAKHARGSVFQDDYNNCAGPYGIAYLR